jgi:hypothetical protein
MKIYELITHDYGQTDVIGVYLHRAVAESELALMNAHLAISPLDRIGYTHAKFTKWIDAAPPGFNEWCHSYEIREIEVSERTK